jgi:hypothetical protein
MATELRRHKKAAFTLVDGSVVRPGDTIVELHMNNKWYKERRRLNLTIPELDRQILTAFAQDLHALSVKIEAGVFGDVVAIHGCTHLGSGARRLGFQVEALPESTWKKWARFYLAGLVRVYGPQPRDAPGPDRPLELKEVWLSRMELFKRYGPGQV